MKPELESIKAELLNLVENLGDFAFALNVPQVIDAPNPGDLTPHACRAWVCRDDALNLARRVEALSTRQPAQLTVIK